MKIGITYEERNLDTDGSWGTARVEDEDGGLLASVTAPIVEGATFNVRNAVVRESVERALQEIGE